MFRDAVVAGQFYPGNREALLGMLEEMTVSQQPPAPAFGLIAPHAGYVYSGPVAGKVYAEVEVPDRIILLNPNHTGFGVRAAMWEQGSWRTPLGDVTIDDDLGRRLKEKAPMLQHSPKSHQFEHSAEVHLPFIQYRNPRAKILPICLMGLQWEHIEVLAKAIAGVQQEEDGNILVIASTDMNHFDSDEVTRRKDRHAIERINALDARGLIDVTRSKDISMCGVYATAVMLYAARIYGVKEVVETAYDTSATHSHDSSRVVGYYGAIVR